MRITSVLLLVVLAAGCSEPVSLSPEHWPEAVREAYLAQMESGTDLGAALEAVGYSLETTGKTGILATTSSPIAIRAGMNALEQGGSATDAALTVALTQVVLHGGGATSFAGQLYALFFDAASGEVSALNASYATVLGEDDPLGIPPYGTPSGRAVLTPGFMAGAEAAHERYGNLPWATLFEPAIYFARAGFPISPTFRALLESRQNVITRLPSGREIFAPDGELLAAGTQFRQQAVAGFLSRVAEQGASYMYEGPWAQQFVTAVTDQGGKISTRDLQDYEVAWQEPLHANINGYDVYGGGAVLEVLRLAELAGIGEGAHYSEDPNLLYDMIRISRVAQALGPNIAGDTLSNEEILEILPGIELAAHKRYTPETARFIHEAMQTPEWDALVAAAENRSIEAAQAVANLLKGFGEREADPEDEDARPNHTAGIIAVDDEGNMAALVHSVTSAIWGELGLFVEGVSVVDPGAFSQHNIERIGPGKHILDLDASPGCPALAVRDGVAVAGCGVVGASYDTFAHQGLVNLLLYEMSPERAVIPPMFRKNWPPGIPVRQPLGEGEFSADVLDAVRARGIDIMGVEDPAQATLGSMFVSAGKNYQSGVNSGGVTMGARHSRLMRDSSGLIEAR